MKTVFRVTQPLSKGACAKAGYGMSVRLKSAGYRDAQKGTEQAGSAGQKQDGHIQSTLFSRSAQELSKVVSAWLCCAMPMCRSTEECLDSTLHSLKWESSHTFNCSDQKKL